MISSHKTSSISSFSMEDLDLFVYGLGYEVRSTALAAYCDRDAIAIRMHGPIIHASKHNADFLREREHRVFNDDLVKLKVVLRDLISATATIRIGFDFSSVNRKVLFEMLVFFSSVMRRGDALAFFYVPASFQEPDHRFPQIESFGPSSSVFSGFQSDHTLPLCLILGAGYETGVSMGMISQLEPRLSYCFWSSGADQRFDDMVQRANFGFKYPSFDVRSVPYPLLDPSSTYSMLESLTFGISKGFRVVIAPMGPKIFSLVAALVAMEHFGIVAVWRVKHSRELPSAAHPAGMFTKIVLDTDMLLRFASAHSKLLM